MSTTSAFVVAALFASVLVSGCAANPTVEHNDAPAPVPQTSPPSASDANAASPGQVSPDDRMAAIEAEANIKRISDHQWRHIVAAGVWRPGCPVGREELRRVEVNHYTFDGEIQRGALVVNRDVAHSVARIFTKLFEAEFPIRKMRPVEAYDGDVNASLRDDNTSAYNCRRPSQINAPPMKSPHANGRAIDVNPRENPWKDLRCDCWLPNRRSTVRDPGPGVILKGGAAWRAFTDEAWIWQNIDVPDYMHFDTGYPSKAYRGVRR